VNREAGVIDNQFPAIVFAEIIRCNVHAFIVEWRRQS
jgi:hypothetical protein